MFHGQEAKKLRGVSVCVSGRKSKLGCLNEEEGDTSQQHALISPKADEDVINGYEWLQLNKCRTLFSI